jgi:hypothetical protein
MGPTTSTDPFGLFEGEIGDDLMARVILIHRLLSGIGFTFAWGAQFLVVNRRLPIAAAFATLAVLAILLKFI